MEKNKENKVNNFNIKFMKLAIEASLESKDPNTKVGCVIVDKNNKVIASSCNNFPKRTKEGDFSWNRDEEWIDSKYPYVVHAELSTILKAHKDLTGCSLYVTLAPCNNCALAISQSGISKVYFLEDKYHDVKEFVAARKILEKSNIKVEQIKF